MAKAKTISEERVRRPEDLGSGQGTDREAEAIKALSSVALIALPVPLMTKLSAEAARRNMRFSELLTRAVEDYLARTDPDAAPPEEK